MFKRFTVTNGQIQLTEYIEFENALQSLWGPCNTVEQDEHTELYHKLDHAVAGWTETAGSGWISLPRFANVQVLDIPHIDLSV